MIALKIKTIVMLSVALLLCMGCSDTESPVSTEQPIRFTALLSGMSNVDTRSVSAVISSDHPLTADLLMSGSSNGYGSSKSSEASFTSTTTQSLSPQLTYPFPASDSYFRALSPQDKWALASGTASGVAGAVDGKTDMMYTPEAGPYQSGVVPFTFKHALALIRVYVRLENTNAASAWGDLTDFELAGVTDGDSPIPSNVSLAYADNSLTPSAATVTSLSLYKMNRLSLNNPYTDDLFGGLTGAVSADTYSASARVRLDNTAIASLPVGYVMTACPAAGLGSMKFRLKSTLKSAWVYSPAIAVGPNVGSGKCVDVYLSLKEGGGVSYDARVSDWDVVSQYDNITWDRKITMAAVDLSAKGTSNCYICSLSGQTYLFDATIRGNGVATPAALYTPDPLLCSADNSVRVLWSMGGIAPSADTDGGDASTVDDGLYSIIKKGTLQYNATDGLISFETTVATLPTEAGNAVIALVDKDNEILWSWHIWFTSYNPDATASAVNRYYTSSNYLSNPTTVMKYHLGSIDYSGVLSDLNNCYKNGLLYQYGRKDAYLAGTGSTGADNPVAGTQYYYNVAAGVADFIYTNGTEGTVALGYQNPMTLYFGATAPYYQHMWAGRLNMGDFWGVMYHKDYKTCFDPCPPGWKVANLNVMHAVFSTGNLTFNNQSSGSVNVASPFNFYYTAKGSGPTTFYPPMGYRKGGSGLLTNVGIETRFWGSGQAYYGINYATSTTYYHNQYGMDAVGCPVRCARE